MLDLSFILIFIFLIFTLFISFIIFFFPFYFIERDKDFEKLSAYECGFMPFDDARGIFDIKFYLVCMLFLIFDLEVVFLFPWTLSFNFISDEFFFSMYIFLIILVIGFIYEWIKGALNWNEYA